MPANKRDEKFIEEIIQRVDRKELVFSKRTAIMDDEYRWGIQNERFNPDPLTGVQQKDAVTTNFPMLLHQKVTAAIAYSEQIIRVEDDADNEEFRDANNAYERFAIGMLEEADKRHMNSGMNSTIRGESAWFASGRGAWVAARAVLIKNNEGDTVPDVVPIDSRNIVYEKGRGEPLWAAVVTQRSKEDIRAEYPDFKFEDEQNPADDNDDNTRVIDYYWTERRKKNKNSGKRMNCVIVQKKFAKSPQDTFSKNFPVVIRLVGNNPGVMNFTLKDDIEGDKDIPGIETIGPSVFTPLRHVIPVLNQIRSYRMALTGKAVQGTMKIFSADGTKEVDQDLFSSGAEANLSRNNQEDIELLQIPQLNSDAAALEGAVSVDEINAGLSEQRFGRLTAPVSGSALQIIGQADNERVAPFLDAVQSLIEGVIDNLGTQFAGGQYKPVKVRGKTHTDIPFNREISSEDIKDHGVLSYELMQVQPSDEVGLWQAALAASATDPISKEALVSKQFAATKIAKVQDYDLEKIRMNGSRARNSSEKTILLTQWEAARRNGDEELVQVLAQDIQRLMEIEEMEDTARRFAFFQAMNQNPIQGAAGGVDGAAGGGGGAPIGANGGGQSPSDPFTINEDPTLFANAGRPGVSREPSPDAGFNTTAPRGGGAESIGLEPNV